MLEFVTLTKILETNLKLLGNIKTHWISMFSPLKWLLLEYKYLVVKMYTDAPKNKPTWDNLDLLCDFGVDYGSAMPPSNVGNNAHINQICLEAGCFYL